MGGDGDAPEGAVLLAGGEDDAPEWMTEDFGAAYEPKQEEDIDALSCMMQMHAIAPLHEPWSDAGFAGTLPEHSIESETCSQLQQPGIASDSRRTFARNAASQALYGEELGSAKASQDVVLGASQQNNMQARSLAAGLAAFNSFEHPSAANNNVVSMAKRNIMAPAAVDTNKLDNRESSSSSAAAQVDVLLLCGM